MNEDRAWKLSDVISHCQQMLAEHGDLFVLLDTEYDSTWAEALKLAKDYKDHSVLYAVLEGKYEEADDRDVRPL